MTTRTLKDAFIEGYMAGAQDYEDGETGGNHRVEAEKEWSLRYPDVTDTPDGFGCIFYQPSPPPTPET